MAQKSRKIGYLATLVAASLTPLQEMEMLYIDQKQDCLLFYDNKSQPVAIKDFPIYGKANFLLQPELFPCYVSSIRAEYGAGLISKSTIGTYMLIRLHQEIDKESKVYHSGQNTEGFMLKIGRNVERSTWRLWMSRKFEPWEGELSLYFLRLYSSGIPDFFLTNQEIRGAFKQERDFPYYSLF